MPLWHNKDKSENPCVARSWRFVLILFPLKNGLEMGPTGGGDKRGLHLKDKFFQKLIVSCLITTFKNIVDMILIKLATVIKPHV